MRINGRARTTGCNNNQKDPIDVTLDSRSKRVKNSSNRQEHASIVSLVEPSFKQKDLTTNSRFHVQASATSTSLLKLYTKCGQLAIAQQVFDMLRVRDVMCWTALIAGYVQYDRSKDALDFYEQMCHEGISPDPVIFTYILKACGATRNVDKGKELHLQIVREGLLQSNVIVGTALVDMYVKCGVLKKAQEAFDRLGVRNVVSWNALITGYSRDGCGMEVLDCFEQMQRDGHHPDGVTFVCLLKACGCIRAIAKGREVHAQITKAGLLEKDPLVGTGLVDMYAKCGMLEKAKEVFDKLKVRNVASWNALITGCVQNEEDQEALNCFERMQSESFDSNAVTFACVLKACSRLKAAYKGKEIHAEIVREGLLGKDALIDNALVDMYVKCGELDKAQEVFDQLQGHDIVAWTSLIRGYAQYGLGHKALDCFEQMQCKGLHPNAVTFLCALKACGSVGAVHKGKELHSEIIRLRFLENHDSLGNALVDMYIRFGLLERAWEVFNALQIQDVVSWNTVIAGYAQHGHAEDSLTYFEQMQEKRITPNIITFTSVLSACSHAGLVGRAQMYFRSMTIHYNIIPTLDHYACMIDLLGRVGYFDEAVALIKGMPTSDHLSLWSALLGACRKWGNVKLGEVAFERAIELNEKDDSAYLCMSTIYSVAGMQEDVDKIEIMRTKKRAPNLSTF